MKQRITIDHVGIAAMTLDEGSHFWELLGLVSSGDDEVVEDQGVITRFFPLASINDDTTNIEILEATGENTPICLLYTSPSPRDKRQSRMPSSA